MAMAPWVWMEAAPPMLTGASMVTPAPLSWTDRAPGMFKLPSPRATLSTILIPAVLGSVNPPKYPIALAPVKPIQPLALPVRKLVVISPPPVSRTELAELRNASGAVIGAAMVRLPTLVVIVSGSTWTVRAWSMV